jgi:hypothetical protein
MRKLYVLAGIAGLLAVAACNHDVLTVPNNNSPDVTRVLNKPSDVESFIGSSFNTIWAGSVGTNTDDINLQMMVMSLENGSSLANFGFGVRISIPRNAIDNTPNNAVAAGNFFDFQRQARGARSASLGLAQLRKTGFTIGSVAQDARARAFAFFVMAMGNANVALVYDSGTAVSETNVDFTPPLIGHDSLMKFALVQFDSAIANAGQMTAAFPLVATWIPSNALTGAQFIQVIRSYKARFRAQVARTPTERAAVDWTKVRDDAINGITADLVLASNPSTGWQYGWYIQHFLFDTWTQESPMFLGMADSAGAYDAYLATPLTSRSAILIRSADQRLPPGADRAAQQTASGTGATQTPSRTNLYFRNRTALDPASLSFVVSQYDWYRMQPLYNANRIGSFPMLQKTEIDLLAAEAYYRLGDLANAVIKINTTRVNNGKLPPLPAGMAATDLVPGGVSCVPRVPAPPNYTSTQCGTLFEALKWEKRMELAFMQYGAWYFDSRGWGDLALGTALEWPVPYQELQARNSTNFNYAQQRAAVKGTYGY